MLKKSIYFFLIQIVAISLCAEQPATPRCPDGIRVRKEFRDMSYSEWRRFKNAVRKLQDVDNGLQYDRWTATHLFHSVDAHSTPEFFPWHRLFTWQFENALRTIHSEITIPYWDWSFDSQDPLKSRLFKKGYLNFKPGPQGDCSWRRKHRDPHCLIRNYDPEKFTTFHDSGTLSRIVRDSRLTYDRFRVLIEHAPHGAVHAGIGGPGGDMTTMISPNDPIFWMHHSFIDKLWADHQKYRPRNDYNGRMHGRRAFLRDIVHPFNMSVEESLDITSLCYSFQPFSRTRTSASRDIALTPMKRNTTHLIVPQPLPDHWIQAHGFNETEIRENEAYLKKLMEEVNAPIMNENRQLILEDMDVPSQQNEEETDKKALAFSVAVGSAQISIVIASLFLISVI